MEKQHFLEKLQHIKAFVFDVDGVFTNNQLIATESGDLMRSFNAKDGFALKTAIERGFTTCIITGGTSAAVHKRFELLGVQHNYYRVSDKVKVLIEFLTAENISAENVLYIGDDIPDFYAMRLCGLKCCRKMQCRKFKRLLIIYAIEMGGDACVREVIEMVLKAQEKWFLLNE
jgi:3-deoxy-D-manno-octulosonate 8-phosphate phosphatase (KDO 8-P phosphatase)